MRPTVEWQVNGRCNYDCSYCVQSRSRRIGAPAPALVDAIVDAYARLPGRWEIKLSGGEPFAYRGLVRHVVPALMARTPHDVSVLTNLSAPLEVLERFCAALGDRLLITSASLHLEHTDVATFLAKATAYRDLRAAYCPRSSFVVNSVLVPGRLDAALAAQRAVRAAGFRYFPQLMKIKGGVYPYTRRDRRLIERICGPSHNPWAANRAPSYHGLHCDAGVWYLVVDQRGEAWRCRTAKRFADHEEREGYLGNLAGGTFVPWSRGGLCPYPICPCTTPANRGVVRPPASDAARHDR
ncbi:MAG: radical SAM protein [Proteobacteria bacterium]|nr:MAG: radical SAM protein [Pseudomonadota bacterium]